MNFKKTIISTTILMSLIATSSEYLVIIKKDDNKYDVIENPLWVNISPTYTNWIETGIISGCGNWTPAISQQKSNFSQESNCDFEQERIKTSLQKNRIDLTTRITNQQTETQNETRLTTRNISTLNDPVIVEKNNYNCETWTPNTNTVYTGTTFDQERYCDVDMMQQWNYLLDGSQINTWQERYTENSGYETQNVLGTKAWDSTDPTYTEWTYTGSILNCGTWNPVVANQEVDFSQSTMCDFVQTRTRTDRELNSDTGDINNIGTELETRNLQETDTRNIITTNNEPLIEQTNYNCEAWTPSANTIYTGTTFDQERYCDVDMMKKWIYSLDGSQINTYEERYTEKTGYETQEVLGTKAWDSIEPIYTNWVYTGLIDNCGAWSPLINQQTINFTQSSTCDFEQSRTRTDRELNSDTGEINITSSLLEKRDLSEIDTRDILVSSNPIIEEQSNYNCAAWSPSSLTVYSGNPLSQQRYCDVDQMQEWVYSLEGTQVNTWENRYTEQSEVETQNTTGTLTLESCDKILLDGFSQGDGYYQVSTPQGNKEVYCDMTTNGGGWTLVTRLNTTDSNTRKWDDSFWVENTETGNLHDTNDYMSPYKNTNVAFKSVMLEFNYNNGVLISEFNNNANNLNFHDSINLPLSNNNPDFTRTYTNSPATADFFGTFLSFQVYGNAGTTHGNDPFRLWYNKSSKEVCNQTGGIGTQGDRASDGYASWWIEAGYPSDYESCQENRYRSYLGTNHGGTHTVITNEVNETLIGNPDYYTTDIINIYIK